MLLTIFLLIIGLVVLVFGAEILVKGASSLADKFGISPIVIGLTVVAFGTSAPELIVNIFSALEGSSDIAIGNVIGSNISNILLVLGFCALIKPLSVNKNTVWKEIPFALLGVVLVYTMGNDVFFDKAGADVITRTDGFSLMAIFAIFMYYVFHLSKVKGTSEKIEEYSLPKSIILTFLGIVALFGGGKLLVDNAVILAQIAGLSESFIGLTIVAIGTSLPEFATSIVAVLHNKNDIAIGNIVGSNIFNIFWILGLTSTMLQLPFNAAINVDVLVAVVATLFLFFAMFVGKKHKFERWQGAFFVISYFVYLAYLIYRG